MSIRQLDAQRVIADPTYAATLTAEEWEALSLNAEWMHITEEYADVVAQTVGSSRTLAQIAPPAPNLGAQQTQFNYIGTKQNEGNEIEKAGLYKRERVIAGPQQPEVAVASGTQAWLAVVRSTR